MIFLGRHHAIFSSYIESSIISSYKEFNTLKNLPIKGIYIDKNTPGLIPNNHYFLHSEIPLISPDLDIKYIFNIEDQMTLYRYLGNGQTYDIDLHKHPETDFIRYILEDSRCKKIICHIKKMSETLPSLLKSDIIKNKIEYQKIGIPIKNIKNNNYKNDFNILFTNSFYNSEYSFYLRGGHILVNVFLKLVQKYPNIKLTLRTSIPKNFNYDYHPNIKIIENFLPENELEELYLDSNIYVLPSCRVHSHSIIQAFSYGLPVISTNGWGVEEFIEHESNGLIIGGFENISWHDENMGCIEHYQNIMSPQLIQHASDQLYYYLEFILNNPEYLNQLRENCVSTCKSEYSLLNWKKWSI